MYAWVEIVKAAAVSPLGVCLLALLLGSKVVLQLISIQDKSAIRLVAMAIFLSAAVGLASAAIYTSQPTVAAHPRQSPADGFLTSEAVHQPADLHHVGYFHQEGFERGSEIMQRADCGRASMQWVATGEDAPDPYPPGWARGELLSTTYRVEEFPPRAQERRLCQCWRH